ncbi:MAG: SPASM domain-containing protein [Desulfovibrio sp.]|jgi:MoaA/NifB/PqqE/SkfB family radical SAM enzyme|nr:SPASM domain-containing protein [Desulfovibrio sp.]
MAEYFMPKRGAGFLNKIYTWLKTGKRFRPSFPRAVEFQTLSTCNAKCLFCPHSQSPERIPHGRMEDGMIDAIIDECSRHLVGRISPYLTNEPLLDKRMPDILAAIRKRCRPFVKTKINTNASLLTETVGRRLIDSGLSQLWFSVNGYSPETYRASMGLDFKVSMANIDAFLALKKKLGRRRPGIKVTTLNTSLIRPELPYAREYWAKRGVAFSVHHMDNRAGSVPANIAPTAFTPKRNCDLFLKQAYIVENGDMILCCHDWRQTVVLGNIARSSIKEIWNSPSFLDRIYEYYAGDFRNIAICRACG